MQRLTRWSWIRTLQQFSFPMRPFVLGLASAYAIAGWGAPPLPSGGRFVAGNGAITTGSQSVTINQTSTRGVIDWRSFSIGSSRTVIFENGSGATLNRVTGGDPSAILGQMRASGSVYLINPQGVLVAPNGVVATGGRFVASALNIDPNAFMQGGPLTFSGGGNGVVINLGKIGSSGGDVLLVSRKAVINAGSIDAPKGTVELATGNQVLLQDASGGQQIFVQAGSGGTVINAGTIGAAQVSLQAADGNVYALAGNSAAIRATGTATRDGHVWLVADKGEVHANGTIIAKNADGSGGAVDTRATTLDAGGATVLAGHWTLSAPTFTIDANGANAISRSLGKGTSVDVATTGANSDITVSGNIQWQGGASLALNSAHSVFVVSGAAIRNTGSGNLTVRADATGIDNGGGIGNRGTIDWSRSSGIVSLLYDMNASYSAGTLLANRCWTAAPFSGHITQITAYKLVNNVADLGKVSQDLKGNYALGKDIDVKTAAGTSFSLIAPTDAAPFGGQFDGFGHVVSNLNIQVPDQSYAPYAGLFGVIGTTGVVRNLGVANAAVEGGIGGSYGALAGRNDGVVAYAWSTGGVGSGVPFGGAVGGGLVGWNKGTVERSWSGASVGGNGSYGGLVENNEGRIVQSYATGPINVGGSHTSGGGLVARNTGLIQQSYGTGRVGSLIGDGALVELNDNTGIIEESFAVGWSSDRPTPDTNGAIATLNSGTIRNDVYWNKETTNHLNAVHINDGGTAPPATNGLTTAQMSNPASFVSWSFGPSGVWAMPAGATHPVLQWQLTAH
ncbi:filamentous hemagglutinin-like protein [Caballeronia calidae]|uniref:Filamentous hemagglutinin-like protein n=1 Tax=Caballeronia calidae TaxID=1777139 RepID=A0A157ZKR6_9BURK|nr:filamentous hemagglutinin N-terminal domain-containing protein [Caballeronia calidae]SAK46085.1 filamentous hemagglutinin-like protein [Caballeronia calidae]